MIESRKIVDLRPHPENARLFETPDESPDGKSYAAKHSASATDTWETQAMHCGRGLARKRGLQLVADVETAEVTGTEA